MRKDDNVIVGNGLVLKGQAMLKRRIGPFLHEGWTDVELIDESELKKEGLVRVVWRDRGKRVTSFVPVEGVKKFPTDIRRDLFKKKLISLGWIQIDIEKMKHRHHSLPTEVYRISPPHTEMGYSFDLELSISPQYSITNPNCGILSIFSPEVQCGAVPPDLYYKEEWTKEDEKRALSYTITSEEWSQPIAWYVHTEERLHQLYKSLTQLEFNKKYPPLKMKKFPKDKPSGLTLDQWSAEINKYRDAKKK